jgi:hypothetical protein
LNFLGMALEIEGLIRIDVRIYRKGR